MSEDERLLKLARLSTPYQVLLRDLRSDPLTDAQIVLATVAVANGARLVIQDEKIQQNEAKIEELLGDNLGPAEGKVRRAAVWQEEVDTLRSLLADLTSNRPSGKPLPDMFWDREIAELNVQLIVRREKAGGLRLHFQFDFSGMDDVLHLGWALLADADRRFGGALCRCQDAKCGLFFFERRGIGRPQRTYCCPEHLTRGHNAGASRRRKNKAEEDSLRTVRSPRGTAKHK